MATYTIVRKLDLLKHNGTAGGIPPVVLRRGDSGTEIQAEVTYGGAKFDLTGYSAMFCAVNADGGVIRREAVVDDADDGIVTYDATTDLTSVAGPVLVAYFELTSEDDEVATTDTLPFIILPNADLDGEEAEEYESTVAELVAAMTEALAAAATATGDASDAADRANAAAAAVEAKIIPRYNADTGRYENLGEWFALHDDGQVYGVRIPKYSYSAVTTATKIGANTSMVLEPSTNEEPGRNDYRGIGLFMCPRVHGGVDKDDMMPFVTSMEEYDSRFDETANNTYIAMPVYYKKITDEGDYILKEYSQTPRPGFKACRGAYTPDGVLRPFILRACYPDSDGQFSSRSGEAPGANYNASVANRVAHCSDNNFTWSKNRASTDGLTYLDYGDVEWLQDFMELMLGVKAPRSKAVGCVSYNYTYTVAQAETDVKRVVLTDAQAANIEIGSSLSVGDNTQTDRYYASVHNIAKSAKVVSKTALGGGLTAVNLDLASTITTTATSRVTTMPWRNGSCDNVLGTFGAPTTAGLTNGKFPFKFQNTEWELGLYEVIHNMHSYCSVVDGVQQHEWYIAPDVSDCSGNNQSTGWTKLDQVTVAASQNAWNSIKDYTSEKGARVPQNVGGTSTTGFMTSWHPGAASAAARETLVGGPLDGGAGAGVGCVGSDRALGGTRWHIGGRSSAIGHSAPAE